MEIEEQIETAIATARYKGEHTAVLVDAVNEIRGLRLAAEFVVASGNGAARAYENDITEDDPNYNHESFCAGVAHGIELITLRIRGEVLGEDVTFPPAKDSGQLNPCPFCGGAAAFKETADGGVFVECASCHTSSVVMFPEKCNVLPLLAERWHRRTK